MSVEALTVVLNHSKAKGTEKLVLIGIANHHGEQGAWPSVATLARYSNMSDRRVQQVLKTLEESGELFIDTGKGAGVGKYKTNLYKILVTCPSDCSGFPQHSQTKPASPLESQTKPASLQDEARFALEVKPATYKPIEEPLKEPLNPQFEKFWEEYPKKKEKQEAKKAFQRAIKKVEFDDLLLAVRSYAVSVRNTELRYIKYPATWLNKESWHDELEAPKQQGGGIWDQNPI